LHTGNYRISPHWMHIYQGNKTPKPQQPNSSPPQAGSQGTGRGALISQRNRSNLFHLKFRQRNTGEFLSLFALNTLWGGRAQLVKRGDSLTVPSRPSYYLHTGSYAQRGNPFAAGLEMGKTPIPTNYPPFSPLQPTNPDTQG